MSFRKIKEFIKRYKGDLQIDFYIRAVTNGHISKEEILNSVPLNKRNEIANRFDGIDDINLSVVVTTITPGQIYSELKKGTLRYKDIEPFSTKYNYNEVDQYILNRENQLLINSANNPIYYIEHTIVGKHFDSKVKEVFSDEDKAYNSITDRDDMESYLYNYPNGYYYNEVQSRLDNYDWEQVVKTNDLDRICQYEDENPGKHTIEIEELKLKLRDDRMWTEVLSMASIENLNKYLDMYPNGRHIDEAGSMLASIASKEEFLTNLRERPNLHDANVIKKKVENCDISWDDILHIWGEDKCNAIRQFTRLNNISYYQTTKESVPGVTNVFFWGCKGSGKTCLLGCFFLRCLPKGNMRELGNTLIILTS